MNYLGDFVEDATVNIYFTTHDADTGAPIAPSSAFEDADVKIYKNGSASEKLTVNGLTMTSPFDTITGLHLLAIDTSNDTGDAGFWVAGGEYSVILSPDETVDGSAVVKVIASFSIERASGAIAVLKAKLLGTIAAGTHNAQSGDGYAIVNDGTYGNAQLVRATTPANTLDVNAGGEAGVDLDNTSGTLAKTTDITGFNDVAASEVVDEWETQSQADPTNFHVNVLEIGGTAQTPNDNGADINEILADTNELQLDDVPGLIAALDDITVAEVLAGTIEGAIDLQNVLQVVLAFCSGKCDGGGGATINFRDQADTKNRIQLTVDADGDRSATTLSLD